MRRGRERDVGCEFATRKQRERHGARSLARHSPKRSEDIEQGFEEAFEEAFEERETSVIAARESDARSTQDAPE